MLGSSRFIYYCSHINYLKEYEVILLISINGLIMPLPSIAYALERCWLLRALCYHKKRPMSLTSQRSLNKSWHAAACTKRHIELLCSVQYSTVQYSTVQYSTVQYSAVQYSTVQYSTVQYSTVQYSTVQYSTVQYSTVQCSAECVAD